MTLESLYRDIVMYDYAIFIQARLGSTRFPRKVLYEMAGKKVLQHVIDACRDTGIQTFLLTPSSEVEEFRKNFDIEVFGGSEADVISRFHDCANKFNVKNIVRITSDCPCLTSEHIQIVVDEHRRNNQKFVSNVAYDDGSYQSLTPIPDGFDVEVFSFDILNETINKTSDPLDREHVTRWMRKNIPVHIPKLSLSLFGKFSLDKIEDVEKIEKILQILSFIKTAR